MHKNGVLKEWPAQGIFAGEAAERIAHEQILKAEQEAAQKREHDVYLKEIGAQGVQLEAADYHVEVDGYAGKLSEAPELSMSSAPPIGKDTLWVHKVKPEEKGTFLVYAPTFQGVFTHYRGEGRGTVLCFKDHTLCQGGHDESTLRWHGFLHAFHFEENKQVFVRFTREGAEKLRDQVNKDCSLRGLKIQIRRPKAKKGPFYVTVIGQAEVDIRKLPKHRDARASIFHLFKIKPTPRMQTAAFSGGEEVPTDD